MLADLLPLMTETVQHWRVHGRNIHGKPYRDTPTTHQARLRFGVAELAGTASREDVNSAAVMMWLVDHPRPIAIGDFFTLSTGDLMQAARVERRALGNAVLSKVTLHAA